MRNSVTSSNITQASWETEELIFYSGYIDTDINSLITERNITALEISYFQHMLPSLFTYIFNILVFSVFLSEPPLCLRLCSHYSVAISVSETDSHYSVATSVSKIVFSLQCSHLCV